MALPKKLRKVSRGSGVDCVPCRHLFRRPRTKPCLSVSSLPPARPPKFEPQLDAAMAVAVAEMPDFLGKTVIIIDVSGSMDAQLSAKSDLKRLDAACGLAIMCRELTEDCRIFAFSTSIVEIPPRRGMALSDAIRSSMPTAARCSGRRFAR